MLDEIREKYYGGEAAAREAFEELCTMVDQLHVRLKLIFLQILNYSVVLFRANVKSVARLLELVWSF